MDELITVIDKPVEFDLDIKDITPVPKYEKDHSRLEKLDYESSGHTGFASSKDLEEVMNIASGKTRSFTLQSLSDLGSLFGIDTLSVEAKYTVTKSQIIYKGETVTLANGYVFYIVNEDVPDYWFSKDDMALYAQESKQQKVYAPTTAGSNGQIPQVVNGETVWVTPNYATTTDIETAIGNVSSLLGNTDDLEV